MSNVSWDDWEEMERSEPRIWILASHVWRMWFAFYLSCGLYVRYTLPTELYSSTQAKIIRLMMVSLCHALISTGLAIACWIQYIDERDMVLHTMAYFVANLLLQFHWIYIPHHVAPLVATEFLLRNGCDFRDWVVVGGWMEAGNAVWQALVIFQGPHRVEMLAFLVSRMSAAVALWNSTPCSVFPLDVYEDTNYTLRVLHWMVFHTILWSNILWLILLWMYGPNLFRLVISK